MATIAEARMATGPIHPKPRAGRTGGQEPFSLWKWGDLCGTCCGTSLVWCPDCAGFAGCGTCRQTLKVLCPECADGEHEPWSW